MLRKTAKNLKKSAEEESEETQEVVEMEKWKGKHIFEEEGLGREDETNYMVNTLGMFRSGSWEGGEVEGGPGPNDDEMDRSCDEG